MQTRYGQQMGEPRLLHSGAHAVGNGAPFADHQCRGDGARCARQRGGDPLGDGQPRRLNQIGKPRQQAAAGVGGLCGNLSGGVADPAQSLEPGFAAEIEAAGQGRRGRRPQGGADTDPLTWAQTAKLARRGGDPDPLWRIRAAQPGNRRDIEGNSKPAAARFDRHNVAGDDAVAQLFG